MKNLQSYFLTMTSAQLRKTVESLSPEEAEALLYDWKIFGRPAQQMPDLDGEWDTWFINAGRGFGKTRTGAETVKEMVLTGRAKRIALVAPTAADARDVMVSGESGLLSVFPPSQRPIYEPSKRLVTFFDTAGREIAIATTFSAEEPERLRGPQYDFAWCDELAAWRYPETWDQLQFGLRLGEKPRVVVTTTPRPNALVKSIVKDPRTIVTLGSTFDNKKNLAANFLKKVVAKYEGTRLGRQELNAEILDDNPGALWNRTQIDLLRVRGALNENNELVFDIPDLRRVVVAIDPAVTSGDDSDETGIIVAGLGVDGLVYILADGSIKETPLGWAKAAVELYKKHGADRVVAEVNNGGDMVEAVMRQADPNVSYRAVRASKGKQTRAEPVAALYEQGRVRHVGSFSKLEDQMTEWDPATSTKSPDRVDALVWALTELVIENNGSGLLDHYAQEAMDKAAAQSPERAASLAEQKAKLDAIFGVQRK